MNYKIKDRNGKYKKVRKIERFEKYIFDLFSVWNSLHKENDFILI